MYVHLSIAVFDNYWVKPGAVRLWSPGIAVSLTGLHGAFVMNPSVRKVRKRDPITGTITYTDGKSHIQREGRVQWKSWQGFAVKFY
jgi:hypothetical protein